MNDHCFRVCASLGALLLTGTVTAQEQASEGLQLEEVTVTAERIEENVQRAAVAVSVLPADVLTRAGVTDVDHLTQLVPELRAIPFSGPYANFTIRGMSNFATTAFQDGAVVVSQDGVPLAHPTSVHGMFYDLERVEVLKGPQGTLYGRNATGGAINVISAKPRSEFGADVALDFGNFNKRLAHGSINVPVSDTLALRGAFQTVRRDGYFSDGTSDEHSDAGRLSARYAPSESFSMTLVGDFAKEGGIGNGGTLINAQGQFLADPWTGMFDPNPVIQSTFTATNVPSRYTNPNRPFEDNKFWGTTLDTQWALPWATLTALAAYRETNVYYLSDLSTFYVAEDSPSQQHSLELRLASPAGQTLRWLVGAYYSKDHIRSHQLTEQNKNLSNSYIENGTETYAGFGQLTYSLTDSFRLTAGARVNKDDKFTDSNRSTLVNFPFTTTPLVPFTNAVGSTVFSVVADQQWSSTTAKVGAEWDVATDSLLYANVGNGFKAGGFFFGPSGRNSYDPEKVIAYTLGSKNRFLGRRLQLNAEAFYLDYTDQQVGHFAVVPGFGNVFVTDNVGKATVYGVEWDIQYLPTAGTRLGLLGQWESATYDQFQYLSATDVTNSQTCPVTPVTGGFSLDCSGRRMPQTPAWVVQPSIEQRFSLSNGDAFVASLSSRYESRRETSLNYFRGTRVDSYTRTDVSLAYNLHGGMWSFTAYVQNLEDKAVVANVFPGRTFSVSNGGLLGAGLQPPRTWGVIAQATF